jgi:hypothetical protein
MSLICLLDLLRELFLAFLLISPRPSCSTAAEVRSLRSFGHVHLELVVDLRVLDLDRQNQLQKLVAIFRYEIDGECIEGDIDGGAL